MTYHKIKTLTGCLIPLSVFTIVSGAVFWAMISNSTGFGFLTGAAPIGLGFCAALAAVFLGRPLHHFMLTRELKAEKSVVRIGAWSDKVLDVEFYAAADGIWYNGNRYYWRGSLSLNLLDVILDRVAAQPFLIFKFSETLDRSAHYFDIRVPIPKGFENRIRDMIHIFFRENIILDEQGNRKV